MVTFHDMPTLTQASLALLWTLLASTPSLHMRTYIYIYIYICACFLGICAFYRSAALLEIPKKPAILYRKRSPQETQAICAFCGGQG